MKNQFLEAFPGRRVLVVGDVMLDEYVWGEVRRISPEAPVPVVEMRRRTYMPGGAANTAANVVGLGGQALLGGVVGPDEHASRLSTALGQAGVDPRGLVVEDGRLTTAKTRIVAHSQQIARVDCEHRASLAPATEDALLRWVEEAMPRADACVLSDYAKGVVSHRLARQVIEMARRARRPVVVDPKGTDYAKYRGATVVKPNLHEVQQVVNRTVEGEADLLVAGADLLGALGEGALLITRGALGMSLFRGDRPPMHISSAARAVFDVTGAGDTVVATLALALGVGAPLEQAARLANYAAGVVVSKVGTTPVTLEEVRRAASRPGRGARKSARSVQS
jgi:D-glycero-beta-D-manno-heptose-7-phosphate kinase